MKSKKKYILLGMISNRVDIFVVLLFLNNRLRAIHKKNVPERRERWDDPNRRSSDTGKRD